MFVMKVESSYLYENQTLLLHNLYLNFPRLFDCGLINKSINTQNSYFMIFLLSFHVIYL